MQIRRGIILMAAVVGLIALTACAGPATAVQTPPAEPIPGTWVEVTTSGDEVSLPLALVEQNVNTHFKLQAGDRELAFMAYLLDGTVYVRANACPPCGSRGFALNGTVLDCNACHTTFNARDGSGIAGACVAYPKAAAQHRIVNGAITMTLSDLVTAYDETLVAG